MQVYENNCTTNAVCPAPKMSMRDCLIEVLNQQNKAIQLLAAIKHDIMGVPTDGKPDPECGCMLDVVDLMHLKEIDIVESLLTIMEALGLGQ